MNIPTGFASEKEKKEIEKIVREILVEKVLVEDIAKELRVQLENERLAEMLKIEFKKIIDISENNNLKLKTERNTHPSWYKEWPSEIRDHIQVEDLAGFRTQELNQILGRLMEEPDMKEEYVIHTEHYYFDVVSKDFIYKLALPIHTNEKLVPTNKTVPFTRHVKKEKDSNTHLLVKPFKKIFQTKEETTEHFEEETKDLPLVNIYSNPRIEGTIKYLKFNHKHNTRLIKLLKERGYDVSLNF